MKAVLVIDIPEECIKCPLLVFEVCQATKQRISMEDITFSRRNIFCPLRPLPEKYYIDNSEEFDFYAEGYNKCLDEILGETE